MSNNSVPITAKKITSADVVRSLLINIVINTLIAAFVTAIGFGRGFVVNFIFSQCIGNSILFASLAATPFFRRATRPFAQLSIIVGSVAAGAIAGAVLGAAANGIRPLSLLRESSPYFGQIVLIGLLFGFIISYIFISLDRIAQEKIKRLEAEKAAMEAELRLIQSQMEPHFLFNTLTNVLGLINGDAEKAGRMLASFTAFLRTSLMTARRPNISLHEEMEMVRHYLAVYEVRMGDRLRYTIDLPEQLRTVPVPPLLVQPLVENAIRHGLEPSTAGGTIAISAVPDNGLVRITVADTGIGIREQDRGFGISIRNIEERLRLRYAGRAKLLLRENSPTGVAAVLELPYEADTGDHR